MIAAERGKPLWSQGQYITERVNLPSEEGLIKISSPTGQYRVYEPPKLKEQIFSSMNASFVVFKPSPHQSSLRGNPNIVTIPGIAFLSKFLPLTGL